MSAPDPLPRQSTSRIRACSCGGPETCAFPDDCARSPERVQLMAECYPELEFGDMGTVIRSHEFEAEVRFDRDGSERLIARGSLGRVTS